MMLVGKGKKETNDVCSSWKLSMHILFKSKFDNDVQL